MLHFCFGSENGNGKLHDLQVPTIWYNFEADPMAKTSAGLEVPHNLL
jgi:hypothetical protein